MAIFDFLKGNKNTEMSENAAASVSDVIKRKIGEKEIREADKILEKYHSGKTNLENRIVENEKWWKLRHWETMRKSEKDDIEPASAWLFNCIAAKHADAMDNFPEINCLPREENDKAEAEALTDILPVVMEQNDFEQTYSDIWWYKLKTGCGVYGIFWNQQKLNGLGDIEIKKTDLLNLFWEPGITDIQKSPNLFHVDIEDNEILLKKYPELTGKLSSPTIKVQRYVYDDTVDTSGKSAVVDWYYKGYKNGREILHYCKYCNGVVLFATENEEEYAERGWYDHGLYPFIFDVLFCEEGTPAGFGYIDICKDPQKYIDLLNQAFLKNTLMNAVPRYFYRADGSVNEEDFLDWTKPLVKVNGSLGEDAISPVQISGLSGACLTMLDSKITELKETSGNRDVSNGGTSGATAASAIAAMQEAGSKLSRDMIKSSYRAFKNINLMCIELIRQFYDIPRSFRILGKEKGMQFVMYKNANLQPQSQGTEMGIDMGYRLPVFDIEVSAQKSSPYSRMAQNELALQFYGNGFFNPQLADQALACLEMMEFTGKESVIQKISQNGTMFAQMQEMQRQMAQMAAMLGIGGGETEPSGEENSQEINSDIKQGDSLGGEHTLVTRARQQAAEAASPL